MAKICPRCSELYDDDAAFCPTDGEELKKSTDRFLGRTIAARYRLTKRLGSGGMSVVYLARHIIIERLSAIKILRQDLGLNPAHRERFLREARAVNRINHKNIVEITDVGESDGVAFLVMEYVKGDSLLSHVKKGAFPWTRAARIGVQVASALARAHQMNVIHRDLKPENIMLVPDLHEDAVKLMDFGIAKMVDLPSLTFSEQLFGTPGYIAPEYVEGAVIGPRADIYSLGIVIYEMLTGTLPYDGRGQADLLLKPLTHAPIPPGQRVGGLPPDLESLVLSMLAKKPEERPHDAFAVHDALIDILRRYGSSNAPPPMGVGSIMPPPVDERLGSGSGSGDASREPLQTIVEPLSALARGEGQNTANVGKLVTSEMGSRWSAALSELVNLVARARKRGGKWEQRASQATELIVVAEETISRLERASKAVGDLQGQTDRLEARGREFRANLGHAIDVLVHDRSREIAHFEALRARKGIAEDSPPSTNQDARVWEKAALAEEEVRASALVEDLSFQILTLQKELDTQNERLEEELLSATGNLEGAISALRTLTNELVRTIDEGTRLVSAR